MMESLTASIMVLVPKRSLGVQRILFTLVISIIVVHLPAVQIGRHFVNNTGTDKEEKGGFVAATAHVDSTCYIGKHVRIGGNARIEDSVRIEGDVTVDGNVIISGKVRISGKVSISGNVEISDSVRINGEKITISDNVVIMERASIRGRVTIKDDANVSGRARVMDDAIIAGQAVLEGTVVVKGKLKINKGKFVSGSMDEKSDTRVSGPAESKEPKVDNTDPETLYAKALDLYDGFGVVENKKEAFKLFQEAAKGGHVNAMFMVGDCYFYGHGINEQKKVAFDWYKQAANKGHVQSMQIIADAYRLGDFLERNMKEAINWNLKLAKLDSISAIDMLKEQLSAGSKHPQLLEAKATIHSKWLRDKDADFLYQLAIKKKYSMQLVSDLSGVFESMNDAYKAGHAKAAVELASYYARAIGVPRDVNMGIKILNQEIEKNSENAHAYMADYLMKYDMSQKDQIEKVLVKGVENGELLAHYYFAMYLAQVHEINELHFNEYWESDILSAEKRTMLRKEVEGKIAKYYSDKKEVIASIQEHWSKARHLPIANEPKIFGVAAVDKARALKEANAILYSGHEEALFLKCVLRLGYGIIEEDFPNVYVVATLLDGRNLHYLRSVKYDLNDYNDIVKRCSILAEYLETAAVSMMAYHNEVGEENMRKYFNKDSKKALYYNLKNFSLLQKRLHIWLPEDPYTNKKIVKVRLNWDKLRLDSIRRNGPVSEKYFLDMAKSKLPAAMYYYALIKYKGTPYKRDREVAKEWMEKAAQTDAYKYQAKIHLDRWD